VPELVPLLVGDGEEIALLGEAGVVHQHVDLADGLDQALGLARPREVALHVPLLPDHGRLAATGCDHSRALLDEQPSRREPDAPGRAGDDADAVSQAQIQGRVV